ncbi:uncharacterized protein LOC123672582 [Harmonia axyridis]|uniref:uncharacterized protein LOC123672582 n=1 Tax=Harmonia axyridis TaxID=115357 RepID=UPI001E2786B5|nr:uncharacterized protein LOC123672582 [Harmonia axyridis]
MCTSVSDTPEKILYLLCTQFDPEYYPNPDQIRMLTEREWNLPDEKPRWLGFSSEGKPYELKEDGVVFESIKNEVYCEKAEVVFNPYMERAFDLKTSQSQYRIIEVYHGTKVENIDSIMKNNFNWRLAGKSRGFKHGKGVCFSRSHTFAQMFCPGSDRILIKTKIPIRVSCIGNVGDILPSRGYDTAESPNGNVLVKFEDSEFLPLYVIYK